MTAPRVLVITPKLHERFWKRLEKRSAPVKGMDTPCWVWVGAKNGHGYGVIEVKLADGRFVAELAHRVAWALVHGALPAHFVCHRCDVPACARFSHLFPGTPAMNSADMVAKGRQATGAAVVPASRPKGEDHYETDLTEDDVRAIRQARALGTPLTELGARYGGLTRQAIWRIVHRKSWKHVE